MYYAIDCFDIQDNSLYTKCAVWGDESHYPVTDAER